MDSIEVMREFLGWCAVINMAMLTFVALAIVVVDAPLRKLHRALFKLSDEDLSRAYFQYLAQFKIVVVIFFVIPWVALKIME